MQRAPQRALRAALLRTSHLDRAAHLTPAVQAATPTSSFASLEQLTLFGARFIDLGVLLPRCPHLRSLMMDHNCHGRGVKALTVESSSLDQLIWHLLYIKQPMDVHVVAPILKNFVLSEEVHHVTVDTQAGGVVLRVLS